MGAYIQIGVPNVIAHVVSCFALEQMTLAAGLLGITEQASQVIMINMAMFAFMVCYGMQSPGCTTVGQQLGRCNIGKAKEYFRAVVQVFLIIQGLEVIVFWQFKNHIVSILTNIEGLKTYIDSVYPLFILNIVFAGLNGMLRGPIYALGLMKHLSKYNLLFQGLTMPALSYLFMFKLHLGMQGLWLSKVSVELLLLLSYSLTLAHANWHDIAYRFMKQRIQDS